MYFVGQIMVAALMIVFAFIGTVIIYASLTDEWGKDE